MKDRRSRRSWFKERFPLSDFAAWVLHKDIPGGTRFAYTLGSALLFLFIVLVLTGIWQLFIYVPTIDHAYDSYAYLRLNVPFGWLMFGLHYWGGNAFAFIVGLHMLRTFIWGAYKKPRELIWLSGVVLLLLTIGFMFTGPILPWDKMGYWACKVGMDMLGDIPGIGSFLQRVAQGTPVIGEVTLDRMFAAHVAIFPLLTALFILVHVVAFRVKGSVGPWKQEKRKVTGPFWPEQIFKDMLVATLVFFLIMALTVFVPPSFSGKADPLNTTYVPKPEWTFLFIYQFLKYFPGKWEPVGIAAVPTFILLLLLSLPFIDRNPERNPFKRWFVMTCGMAFVAFVVAFAIIGYKSVPPNVSPKAIAPPPATHLEHATVAQAKEASFAEGKKLFVSNGCNLCHTVQGKPSHKLGPDLILALSARKHLTPEWLRVQLDDPKKHNPYTSMPAYDYLSAKNKDALLAFLEHLSKEKPQKVSEEHPLAPTPAKKGFGQAINMIGSVSGGRALYDEFCIQCHGPQGNTHVSGFKPVAGVPPLRPMKKALYSKDPELFVRHIDMFIQHGTVNPENGPDMPAFGDTEALTQPEIADIEAYVLSLNGVKRAEIKNPGVPPATFFYITLGLAGGLGLIGWLYLRIKRGK